MDSRTGLQRAFNSLLKAPAAERQAAYTALQASAKAFLAEPDVSGALDSSSALRRDAGALSMSGGTLEGVDDAALEQFNDLLPWAAMTVDPKGRAVGRPWSASKRSFFGPLIDPRLKALNAEMPLAGKHVLEMGCFEGIHTLGLIFLGAKVTGVEGRVENVLKTLARLWAYGQKADVVLWNLEENPPATLPAAWDVLHHVGVLYHLSNPVEHLEAVLPLTKHAFMLDTHVARDEDEASASYSVNGTAYAYRKAGEQHRDVSPFAGMGEHAKWLRVEDLHDICKRHGFKNVRTMEDRDERNGRRVLIWAFRR